MRKALLTIALLFGLASLVPMQAQRDLMVATSEGTAAASLEELAQLAEDGTPVMLWNNGRGFYIENGFNASGAPLLSLWTPFEAGAVSTNLFLWRLEKAEGENNYRLLSLADGKYMYMADATPSLCSTVSPDENTPEVFTVQLVNEENSTFCLKANNVTTDKCYLNGNGGGGAGHDQCTVVGWSSTTGNSEYKIMVPEVTTKTLYSIVYSFNFYDGNSNDLLQDKGLDALIPSAVANSEDGTITAEASIGDTVSLPSYSNTVIRNAMMGDTQVTDSATFELTEAMVASGSAAMTLNYTSNPQITFICTMDLSEIGGAEGEYLFPESGDVTQVSTARFAVGDTLTAPAIANFTALTDLSQHVATVTEEVAVVYRPWRLIMANCGFLLSDSTTLSSVRNVEIYVDLGDTLQAPDLGELYTFDADATSLRSGITFPLVIDAGNIYNGMSLELVYNRVVPFKLSELNDDFTLNEETATWYVLRIRGSKIISSQVGDDGMLICNANVTVDDGALWTIAEAPDGSGAYLLYNKANPGKVLCDVQGGLTYPEFADITGAEMGFDLVNITNGYGLRLSSYYNGQENVMINDLSNAGHIGYWDNAAAWSDAGSTVTFEEYDPANYTFLVGRSYLNAQDCIDGYTADQLSTIREYIEEGDVNMESEVEYICDNELRYDENRVKYVDGDVYAIISGASQYIQRNNVKMGLYVREDSVLAWKEFDPTDNRFYFQLTDIETLKDLNGQDSTVFGLYNVGAEGHLWGNFVYGGQVKLAAEYNTATDRYHAVPVEELTNTETGAVTRSYVPAGFYIQRLKPGTWDNPDSAPVIVTFCMHTGAVNANTEGTVTSYNTHQDAYANVFRFYHLGTPEQVGIGSVTADNQEAGDGKLYDLSGRQLQSEPEKGVYIKNGKTVVK